MIWCSEIEKRLPLVISNFSVVSLSEKGDLWFSVDVDLLARAVIAYTCTIQYTHIHA